MSQPLPPPIQPPRPQHQPPAPKPVNMGLVAGMVIVAFAVTGLAIWAGIEQQKKPAGSASGGRGGQRDADRRKILADAGHDPDKKYPLWPLVIHTDFKSVKEGGRVVIIGKISNHGEKDYEFVGVEFSLYDENGHVIGSASDRISGLRAGETWAYRAITYEKNWKRSKMVDITAW